MTNVVQVDGGEISSTYWCEVCKSYLDKNFKHFEDGIIFGEFKGEDHYEDYKKNYLCPKRNVLIEKHDVFYNIRQARKALEQNY